MLSRLFRSRALRAAATVGLTISAVAIQDPLWWWLAPFGIVIVASELLSELNDRKTLSTHNELDRRVMRTIADMGSMTADKYHYWIVDVYVHKWTWTKVGPRKRLVRRAPLSLSDVKPLPRSISTADDSAFARVFKERKPALWWDLQLGPRFNNEENYTTQLDLNHTSVYGAVSINPLTDHANQDCRGVLIVQTKADSTHVAAALSVFRSAKGRRLLADACHDICGHLASV